MKEINNSPNTQRHKLITEAIEKQHGKEVAKKFWTNVEERNLDLGTSKARRTSETSTLLITSSYTIESVEKTIETIEAILDGNPKPIDQRSIEIIINVSSHLRHSSEFIKGLSEIYKNSDKAIQKALLIAKFEILRKYTFCGELDQQTNHLETLDTLDDGGTAYERIFEEVENKIQQITSDCGKKAETGILNEYKVQLIKRMQSAMKICHTKRATILAFTTLLIVLLIGYTIH